MFEAPCAIDAILGHPRALSLGRSSSDRATPLPTTLRGTRVPIVHVVKARLDGSRRLGLGGKALVVVEVLAEYARVWWGLRRNGLRATLDAVARPAERDDPRDGLVAVRMGRAVDRTLAALPSDSRCLIRAVVLARVLARRGIGSRVVLGAKAAPDFTAHAWVEHHGVALLPAHDYMAGRLAEL
jgi:hypothetical protein